MSRMLDRIASMVTKTTSSPVLVDGRPWDGSPLGDVALVMTPNKNVVKQHQRVVRACVAAGLEVALVYVDMGESWTPALEDYAGLGGRVVRLPLEHRRMGLDFPSPFVMLSMLAQLEAIFPRPPFAVLATHLDDYGLCKLLCYWARKYAVPSVVLQEGMMVVRGDDDPPGKAVGAHVGPRAIASWLIRHTPHDLFEIRLPYSYADYFCAYGQAAKDELVRHGRPSETIFVVGNPSFDHVPQMPSLLPTHQGRHTLMYVQQDIVERPVELRFYDELAGICCDENGDRLIIKLHPLSDWDTEELSRALPQTDKRSALLKVVKTGDATEMLDDVDVLVTVNSTTAYHAMVRGIPVVTVNYLTEGFGEFDAYRYGGAIDVRDADDLEKAILDAVLNEDVRRQLHKGAEQVIEDHLYRLDGCASARIAQVILELGKGARDSSGKGAGAFRG